MNTRFTTLVVVTIIVAVASTISQPTTSGASVSASLTNTISVSLPVVNDYGHHNERPDACRTYRFGGSDMSDGDSCGIKGSKATPVVAVEAPVVQQSSAVAVQASVAVVENPVVAVVVVVKDADTCTNANPGNTKCKGKAGEDPNGKGTMAVDNAGGGGNGAHGNQGQGGNGKNKDK